MTHIVCHRGRFIQRNVRAEEAIDLDPIPFVLVPRESATRIPPDVVVRPSYDRNLGYMMDGLRVALEIGAEVANISLGPPPPPDGQLDESDPLVVATRTAWEQNMLTCVAAGNYGDAPGTVGHLARSPWVVSVGAVNSSGAVLPSSSRGIDDGSGPDICAEGSDTHPEPMPAGTSFATAKVSLMAAWTFAMIRWLGFAFETAESVPIRIVRPSVAFLDTGLRPDSEEMLRALEEQRADALRSLGFEEDVAALDLPAYRAKKWCADIRSELNAVGLKFAGSATPFYTKRIICAAAEPAVPSDPRASGAGVVSEESLWRFYSSFTPSVFYRCFGESDDLTSRQEHALEQLDAKLGSFWREPEMYVAWNAFYLAIDRAHLKVVAGYGERGHDPNGG